MVWRASPVMAAAFGPGPAHVADDETPGLVGDREGVVEVASDLDGIAVRPVADRHVDPWDARELTGKKARLQRRCDLPLLVREPPVLERRRHPRRDRLREPEVLVRVEAARFGHHELQRTDDPATLAQRHLDAAAQAQLCHDPTKLLWGVDRVEGRLVDDREEVRLPGPDHLRDPPRSIGIVRVQLPQGAGVGDLGRVGVGDLDVRDRTVAQDVERAPIGPGRYGGVHHVGHDLLAGLGGGQRVVDQATGPRDALGGRAPLPPRAGGAR